MTIIMQVALVDCSVDYMWPVPAAGDQVYIMCIQSIRTYIQLRGVTLLYLVTC